MTWLRSLTLSLLSAVCFPAWGQTSLTSELNRVASAAHTRGDFSGVVVVSQHGNILWQSAYGEADPARHLPITSLSVFRLASLTKQVTAVLVMQQVEQGSMRLDQPVSELLPGVSPTTGRVTVQQLLQHISGVPNPTSGPGDQVLPFYRSASVGPGYLQQTARGFCSGLPVRAPDEKFEYNNCDYLVLGAALERSTGMHFNDLLKARITTPLQLRSWGFFSGDGRRPAVVRGFDAQGKLELLQNAATYGSAGALYGNALDVAKWNDALLAHRLLTVASTEVLFHGERSLGGEALGSWSYDLPGTSPAVHLVERQGDIGGTRVLSLLLPAFDANIVILANTERADLFNTYSQKGLGFELVKAFTGR